jgi:50S ribosomal protein L16 3-hydroxylase
LLDARRTISEYALSDAFWSEFRETHWERAGTVLAQPFAAPLATPDEIFACLVEASNRYRAGDGTVSLEFCIGHTMLLVDIGRHLPERADGSIGGYVERVTRLLDGRRFGLVVEDVQAYDATLWVRLRDFLRGLYERTGMPGDCAKATVYAGNYDRTPFGLHRGNSGTFMFVVDGQKRMRTWPDAFFRDKEDLTHRLDYAHYNDASIVLDAAPGDVIYWPSDYWHIGESVTGAMSAAISVALFMEPRPTSDVMALARGMVQAHLSTHDPTRIAERAAAALRSVGADPRFERAIRTALLNKTTAYGFARAPLPLPAHSLTDDDVVHGLAEYPVIWMREDDDRLTCSACGHAFGISASPLVLKLLERLNDGEPALVSALIAEYAGSVTAGDVEFITTPDDVRALLEKLVSLRAVVVERAVTAPAPALTP